MSFLHITDHMVGPDPLNIHTLNWSTAGLAQLALLYPNAPVYYCSPDHFDAAKSVVDEVDFVLVGGGSDGATLSNLISAAQYCRDAHKPVISMDSTEVWGMIHGTPETFSLFLDLYAACDAVFVQHSTSDEIVQAFTDVPTYPWYGVSVLATLVYERPLPAEPRTGISIPYCFTERTLLQRSDVLNGIVASQLHKRYPDLDYAVVAGVTQELPESLCSGQFKKLGLDCLSMCTGNMYRLGILKALQRSKLLINLEHAPSMGQFSQDACAAGTPVITSRFTGAGDLLRLPLPSPISIKEATELAVFWLEDEEAWQAESQRVAKISKQFSVQVCRETLDRALNAINEKRESRDV